MFLCYLHYTLNRFKGQLAFINEGHENNDRGFGKLWTHKILFTPRFIYIHFSKNIRTGVFEVTNLSLLFAVDIKVPQTQCCCWRSRNQSHRMMTISRCGENLEVLGQHFHILLVLKYYWMATYNVK